VDGCRARPPSHRSGSSDDSAAPLAYWSLRRQSPRRRESLTSSADTLRSRARGGLADTHGAAAGVRRSDSRARYPDRDGFVDRDGVQIFFEVYGSGPRTFLLLPTSSIVHSRMWKAQIPYLARYFRVVTFDPRGNGRSDRPDHLDAYGVDQEVGDAIAVLDTIGAEQAIVTGLCAGAGYSVALAAAEPERIVGIVPIAPGLPFLSDPYPDRTRHSFDDPIESDEGWAKYNRHYWDRDFRGFAEFFFEQLLPEPHSTKQFEDCVGWAVETTPESLTLEVKAPWPWQSREEVEALCRSVRCPVLVLHGERDLCQPPARGAVLAELTGGSLVVVEGAGHLPQARHPVKVNRLLHEFADAAAPPRATVRRWKPSLRRERRALLVSSPIGLGHARRDVAIAKELRRLVPGLEVDWLAQHPVTTVLEAEGERIHPASAELANESAHLEADSGPHELHVFESIRHMDEILVANFMTFLDVARDEHYDLWICDEAWEIDYHLHENPELKTAGYVWMTDFVGWLPMPHGGEREAMLTADLNAEMVAHVGRYPRVRDRSIFIGDAADIVPERLGPGLPRIRTWAKDRFRFTGYIAGFDPAALPERDRLRAELGYAADEQVCIATVGGSSVGEELLRRVISAYPATKRLVPDLRLIIVAGPRIDPTALEAPDGVELRRYVHDLHRHLAACDLAIVHGGLATTMELTVTGRPFLYFPLVGHFEQNLHVAHRLQRHRAGRRMDFERDGADALATAIAEEIGTKQRYRTIDPQGAVRAAEAIAELL
jgi:pimeloyl-ACP methyl ester carboxylesterase/spore coat polysaccharide biosynthesis predicted glycosyltransferase SpsG